MARPVFAGYVLDPADPRAPTQQQWEAMTPAERARVVDMLPTSLPIELAPPEGDLHRTAKQAAFSALDDFFRRAGRRIYLTSELLVLYPDEPGFTPDVMAVLDVEAHPRMRWVVSDEGKGPDFVLEVHVAGDRAKDEKLNVERYARLGIREYFVFDRSGFRLLGFRATPGARTYKRLVPQAGRFASEVLGLDLSLVGDRLHFFSGTALLEDADERIARLGAMIDEVIVHKETAETARRAAEEQLAEERRLRGEAERGRQDAERQLAEALAEIERLKRGGA